MKIKEILELASKLTKITAPFEEIEKAATLTIQKSNNADADLIYAQILIEQIKSPSNVGDFVLENIYDILTRCAKAKINPPNTFEAFNAIRSLNNPSLYKNNAELREIYNQFMENAISYIKERKTSTVQKIQSIPQRPVFDLVSDLKNALAKRAQPSQTKISTPPQQLPATSAPKTAPTKIDLKKYPLVITKTAISQPSPKPFNFAPPQQAPSIQKATDKSNEDLLNQLKQEKEANKALQDKLNAQQKVLLSFHQDAKDNAAKYYETQDQLIKAQKKLSDYYLANPFSDPTISNKEAAQIVNYISEDFNFISQHKNALDTLKPDDKLRNFVDVLYEKFNHVNQHILFGISNESEASIDPESKKLMDEAIKQVHENIHKECVTHIQKVLLPPSELDKDKKADVKDSSTHPQKIQPLAPESDKDKKSQTKDPATPIQKAQQAVPESTDEKQARLIKEGLCANFFIEILKRIDYLKPTSTISLLAKKHEAFIQRNHDKILEDAKNLYDFTLKNKTGKTSENSLAAMSIAPTEKVLSPSSLFASTSKASDTTNATYLSTLTGLLSTVVSRAFGKTA